MIGRSLLILLAGTLCGTARAEFPMTTESALIEEVGDIEIAVWADRDRRRPRRSSHAQIEFVIADGVEVELSLARRGSRNDEDGSVRPTSAREIEIKWVPFRKAHGWSWGVAAGRSAEGGAREIEVKLLGSLPLEGEFERAIHLNLGRERDKEDAARTQRSVLNAGNVRLGIMLGENRAGTVARIGFLADFD